jgi:hypothetical protein
MIGKSNNLMIQNTILKCQLVFAIIYALITETNIDRNDKKIVSFNASFRILKSMMNFSNEFLKRKHKEILLKICTKFKMQ